MPTVAAALGNAEFSDDNGVNVILSATACFLFVAVIFLCAGKNKKEDEENKGAVFKKDQLQDAFEQKKETDDQSEDKENKERRYTINGTEVKNDHEEPKDDEKSDDNGEATIEEGEESTENKDTDDKEEEKEAKSVDDTEEPKDGMEKESEETAEAKEAENDDDSKKGGDEDGDSEDEPGGFGFEDEDDDEGGEKDESKNDQDQEEDDKEPEGDSSDAQPKEAVMNESWFYDEDENGWIESYTKLKEEEKPGSFLVKALGKTDGVSEFLLVVITEEGKDVQYNICKTPEAGCRFVERSQSFSENVTENENTDEATEGMTLVELITAHSEDVKPPLKIQLVLPSSDSDETAEIKPKKPAMFSLAQLQGKSIAQELMMKIKPKAPPESEKITEEEDKETEKATSVEQENKTENSVAAAESPLVQRRPKTKNAADMQRKRMSMNIATELKGMKTNKEHDKPALNKLGVSEKEG
eukprot:m.186735 g.186735  ORF g.186735 m.186735 type:complete len:470 (-) comp15595_c2_seq1:666-2075(-)